MRFLFGKRRKASGHGHWDPEAVLLEWTRGAPWTIRDSFQGMQIFGSTGGGKSSGSLALVCRNLLRAGYGGIFFTVKREDRATYEQYVEEADRSGDLEIFSPDHLMRFNFVASEIEQSKDAVGIAENISALVMTVAELGDRNPGQRSGGGSENAEYFRQASMRLCRHAMFVLVLSGRPVTVPSLHALIISAPRSREEARSEEWQKNSFCYECIHAADRAPMNASQRSDFELALMFFLQEWADLSSKTRSTVESTLTSATDALSRGAVRDMMSAPNPNFSPSLLAEGGIVIADFPVLLYRDIGQLIQVILKYCVQRWLARRDVIHSPRPVFIVCDECHLLTVEADQSFQTTARSSNTAVVYATQSISTYMNALGPQSEATLHSLLGNLQTQVFHQQTDVQTVKYVQELTGRSRQLFMNGSTAKGADWLAPLFGENSGGSAGFSESFEYEIQASDLNSLTKGGPPHWYTEALVFQGGRKFANGRTWCPVRIAQRQPAIH
jgi:hypothetical protein